MAFQLVPWLQVPISREEDSNCELRGVSSQKFEKNWQWVKNDDTGKKVEFPDTVQLQNS